MRFCVFFKCVCLSLLTPSVCLLKHCHWLIIWPHTGFLMSLQHYCTTIELLSAQPNSFNLIRTVFPSLFITWSVLFDEWNDCSLQLKQSLSKLIWPIFGKKFFEKNYLRRNRLGEVSIDINEPYNKSECSQSNNTKLPWRLNYRFIMYL